METFAPSLRVINETLASAIVVIAFSLLLYNLTRNQQDRVARTSGIVLGCMTLVYVIDVFVALQPGLLTYEAAMRVQWIGIAFMPIAMYHLSDALLATTGLPSRGRRRRVIRLLYLIGAMFVLLAAFSNALIQPVRVTPLEFPSEVVISLRAKDVFPLYVLYAAIVTGAAFYNVQRARVRCLARGTRRRMGYLQIAILTPAVGVFPFSVLLGAGEEFSFWGLLLVNAANIVVILMLLFLAYPLSFFGSRVPDRQVKADLLRFILRGPATALLALVTITYTAPATRILGLPGEDFSAFAVVAVVLLWQWLIQLAIPPLEKWLIYSGEDYERMSQLQGLGERLLTRADLLQLIEAQLEAICDYLRVTTAFVVSFNGVKETDESENGAELLCMVGALRPAVALLYDERATLAAQFEDMIEATPLARWGGFWLTPLYSHRDQSTLRGILGIQARAAEIVLTGDELPMLHTAVRRAEQTLDDLALQSSIFVALEGLLPQINLTRTSAADLEYSPSRAPGQPTKPSADKDAIEDEELFKEQVRAALRHFWGGPGLSESRLIELQIVQDALAENDNNPTRALRAVLTVAIERQRPDGDRKLLSPEWTIYNILEMRFLNKSKVRDVAAKLAMGESDLYRKQNVAIAAVAETLMGMENGRRQA
ncbi:MAG: hypothetical protein SGI73_04855 [Chloroflexota bacterium]|nr:hypothetical protein [Chloroflexota bacterium]